VGLAAPDVRLRVMGSAGSCWRWSAFGCGLLCLALIALALVAVTASRASGGRHSRGEGRSQASKAAPGRVLFATTGNRSEIRETVPIARRKWARKRVVMSLGPHKLPALRPGDALRTSAEVQISNTCIAFGAPRCIGRHYGFSPREDARIVLANGRQVTGGGHAEPIAEADSLRCHQPLPNRNHHCVLALHGTKTVRSRHGLPCRPRRCYLNLVLEADHPMGRHGQVILVGADRPSGTVRQDKGRLNAVVLRGRVPRSARFRTRKRTSRSVPIAPKGEPGKRVIYSQRVGRLRRGDVIEARATPLLTISSVPYNAFIGTRLILARSKREVASSGLARRAGALDGEIAELNGFNCTHGHSAYRDPCRARKVGALRIRKNVVDRHGNPVPIYVNLVVGGKAKRTAAGSGDRLRALSGGLLRVRRYRAA